MLLGIIIFSLPARPFHKKLKKVSDIFAWPQLKLPAQEEGKIDHWGDKGSLHYNEESSPGVGGAVKKDWGPQIIYNVLTLGTEAQAAVIRNEATRHISTPRFQGSEAENLLIFTEQVNKPRVLWDYCWNTLAASFLSSYPKVKITVLHKEWSCVQIWNVGSAMFLPPTEEYLIWETNSRAEVINEHHWPDTPVINLASCIMQTDLTL